MYLFAKNFGAGAAMVLEGVRNDETRMTPARNASRSDAGGNDDGSWSFLSRPRSDLRKDDKGRAPPPLAPEDEDEHEGRGRPEAIRTVWPSRSAQSEFSDQNDE